MDPPSGPSADAGASGGLVTLQVSKAVSSSEEESIPSIPRVPSPSFRNSSSSLNLGTYPREPGGSPCRSPAPPSSPQGPRFRLVLDGLVQVCRLNRTRTLISKILSSRFLRRWEGHHIILKDTHIMSKHCTGFMEDPISYTEIEKLYIVDRWDSSGRFCIRLFVPDGSVLFQVSNTYLRDQWFHSLLWMKNLYKYRNVLDCCKRPEILLKELRNLVDLVLSTPLQDESLFHSALDIISDVVEKGQKWMTRSIAEDVIVTISILLERTTPTSDICDFFCWHCRENPRSTVVLDICTPIVQRILKHNMDFGKYPQTRVFVQEYFLALNCQNLGDKIIKDFVDGIHGPGSKCPHPRVLQNLVNICVAAIYTFFENRTIGPFTYNAFIEWDRRIQCFTDIFLIIASFDDWRADLAEMMQPIPFHGRALKSKDFMSKFKEVVRTFSHDKRCSVHQMVLGIREEKEGWFELFCPELTNSDDNGELWCAMVDTLLSCCQKRRKFLELIFLHVGPCLLRAIRNDERCQRALCALLEFDVIDTHDFQMRIIRILQSSTSGKRLYAELCEKQMHLRQVQQKGGPKRIFLPTKYTDADVSRLLSSGSFGDLECLSLAFTQVTSACAEELIKLSSLKYLSLWSTQFDDSGLILLSEHLRNLQALDLCETRVTDHGLTALTEMKSLKILNLNSTRLHRETFEFLKSNLPVLQECDVRYTDAWGF